MFNGNKDFDSIVYHKLNPPIEACYIRLIPTAWSGHISLRMELYGCFGMIIDTLVTVDVFNLVCHLKILHLDFTVVTYTVMNGSEYMKYHNFELRRKIYMLFPGLASVRIVKNCDRGLEFSSPRSQAFTIRTDPKPTSNLLIFFLR